MSKISHQLRNQLTPIYGLAEMVMMLDENPDIFPIIKRQAKLAMENKQNIDNILKQLEL